MNDRQPEEAQPLPRSMAQPQPAPAEHAAAPSQPPPQGGGLDPEEVDFAFAQTISPEAAHFGESAPPRPLCQWCNAQLPSRDVSRCPTCGVLLHPADTAPELPGVTAPAPVQPPATPVPGWSSPTAAPAPGPAWGRPAHQQPVRQPTPQPNPEVYEGLTPEEIELLANSSAVLRQEISKLGSQDAYQPPSRDVRQQMLQIEFEADRADPMRIVDPGPLAEHRREEPPL